MTSESPDKDENCENLVKKKEKELFNQLPQWNGEILTYRLVFKFIRNELPQLSHSLVNIITDYFGGAPFNVFFQVDETLSVIEHSQCFLCGKKTSIALYEAIAEYYKSLKYIYRSICDLCWPYAIFDYKYGSLFIRWHTLRSDVWQPLLEYSMNQDWTREGFKIY
jgi:hypothetical protein